MSDKSHVTLAQATCLVCGKVFETGDILLDTRLRKRFEMHTHTGQLGLCPHDKKLYDDGFLAIVEVDPTKTPELDHLQPHEAYRTGRVMHIKHGLAAALLEQPLLLKDGRRFALIFGKPDLLQAFADKYHHDTGETLEISNRSD